jgi:hypothetical protein
MSFETHFRFNVLSWKKRPDAPMVYHKAGFEGLKWWYLPPLFFYHFTIYVMKTKQLKIGKYVIVNGMPVMFPLEIVHSDIVQHAQSAGFFVIRITSYEVDVYCWGESTSLGLRSNQAQDARIIKEFINTIADVSHRFAGLNTTGSQSGMAASSSI